MGLKSALTNYKDTQMLTSFKPSSALFSLESALIDCPHFKWQTKALIIKCFALRVEKEKKLTGKNCKAVARVKVSASWAF